MFAPSSFLLHKFTITKKFLIKVIIKQSKKITMVMCMSRLPIYLGVINKPKVSVVPVIRGNQVKGDFFNIRISHLILINIINLFTETADFIRSHFSTVQYIALRDFWYAHFSCYLYSYLYWQQINNGWTYKIVTQCRKVLLKPLMLIICIVKCNECILPLLANKANS